MLSSLKYGTNTPSVEIIGMFAAAIFLAVASSSWPMCGVCTRMCVPASTAATVSMTDTA